MKKKNVVKLERFMNENEVLTKNQSFSVQGGLRCYRTGNTGHDHGGPIEGDGGCGWSGYAPDTSIEDDGSSGSSGGCSGPWEPVRFPNDDPNQPCHHK